MLTIGTFFIRRVDEMDYLSIKHSNFILMFHWSYSISANIRLECLRSFHLASWVVFLYVQFCAEHLQLNNWLLMLTLCYDLASKINKLVLPYIY